MLNVDQKCIRMTSKISNKPGDMRKKNRFFSRLAAAGAGVLFGLVIIEAGLRIVGYSSPEFYQPSETQGYSLIPNSSGWYKKEGRAFVRINSDGFRDVEHQIAKPDGTFRIAVIGDSYVEALQVSQEEMFTKYLAEKASGCGFADGKKLEVLNFGVSGYGTAQELLMTREKVWKYSPDLVLLLMTTNNDISDNLRVFKQTPIPYFVMKDGALSLDNSFRNDASFALRNSKLSRTGAWFKQNLRFVQGIGEMTVNIKYWYGRWKAKRAADSPISNDESPAQTADIGIDSQIYREPSDENWKMAWSVTEGLISMLRRETLEKGAKFAVVTLSNGVQVLPSLEGRQWFQDHIGVGDLFYPDKRIAQFCRSNEIPVITLAPELGAYASSNNIFLHGFEGNIGYGHWNQMGHRVAGEIIGRHLCEQKIY